jgi:hypothetical protein
VLLESGTVRSIAYDDESRWRRQRLEGIDDEVDILVPLQPTYGDYQWLMR